MEPNYYDDTQISVATQPIELNEEILTDSMFLCHFNDLHENKLQEAKSRRDDMLKFITYEKSDGSIITIKKSSILWLLLKKKTRISPDRMLRFLGDKKDFDIKTEEQIWIGEHAVFVVNEKNILVGQVLGFKYLSGKRKNYSLEFCQIQAPEFDAKGVEVLLSFYQIHHNKEERKFVLLGLSNENQSYLNLNHFVMKIKITKQSMNIEIAESYYQRLKEILK